MTRTAPRYDLLFKDGEFNATFLIGPDPWDAKFDLKVFFEAGLRLRKTGFKMTGRSNGFDEFKKVFNHNDSSIRARLRLVYGRDYYGDLQQFWLESLLHEDFIYLKSHAGYGTHLSLSDDVSIFTESMKEGLDRVGKKPYQLYYLDCCKSEMYYRDIFRDYVGSVDLILHKWFCDYRTIGPVVVLLEELMAGSDFKTIVARMNAEYGTPHIDVEDKPEDLKLDRKMVTYSINQGKC